MDGEGSGLLSIHDHPVEARGLGIRRRSGGGFFLETQSLRDPLGMELAKEVDKFGVLQLGRVLFAVNKPVLRKECGHGRFPQYCEVGPLHAPVGPTVSSDNNLMEFLLVFLRFAGDGPIEDVGFKPRSTSSIDMNGDEVISTPIK